MGLSVGFNSCLQEVNILEKPTRYIGDFFNQHPTAYKITLIVNHLFRAAAMVGFMYIPGISLPVGLSICFVGSLFYRLTVEKNCAYKFALPAFAGAAAFMLALPAIISMINGVAFISASTGFLACASIIPLILYSAYVLLTVNYDVDTTFALLQNKELPKTPPIPEENQEFQPPLDCCCSGKNIAEGDIETEN